MKRLCFAVTFLFFIALEAGAYPCAPLYPLPTNETNSSSRATNTSEDDLLDQCSNVSVESLEGCEVPNIFHGVFLQSAFEYHHYIALQSVYQNAKPDAIFLHGFGFPRSALFNRSVERFGLILIRSRRFKRIFNRRIYAKQHKADIIRMEVLMKYGGYYADLDVFALRDFTPLLQYPCVLGYEKYGTVCNGVIVAKPCAPFMRRWYKTYTTFRCTESNNHSGLISKWLVQQVPSNLIHIEPCSFHRPGSQEEERALIYSPNNDSGVDLRGHYAIHLWYRFYGKYHPLTAFRNLSVNNLYGRLASWILGYGPEPVELGPRPADFKPLVPGCM